MKAQTSENKRNNNSTFTMLCISGGAPKQISQKSEKAYAIRLNNFEKNPLSGAYTRFYYCI